MTRQQMTTLVGGLVLALTATTASAQVARERAQPDAPATSLREADQNKETCLASELIGMSIKDSSQQAFGTVKDAVIDHEGQVRYLAVSVSGESTAEPRPSTSPSTPATADRSGQYVLIPFEAINANAKQETGAAKTLVLTKSKAELMKAPKFSHAQLSGESTQWMAEVDRFFDIKQRGTSARPDLERNREREQDRNRDRDDLEDKSDDDN